ncbi:MAG: hydroxymethylbilane synthase [Chloroflexota bacterium]|nr:hydroxymethylbilane synthase [Chloroflexota bacterium]
MVEKIIVGSRGSRLAVIQAQEVIDGLRRIDANLNIELKTIKTEGDRDRNTSLTVLGGRGVFVKEIEDALLRGDIDIAVHSLKDMPTDTPPGQRIAATLERLDPRDVLVSPHGGLSKLPPGARIGTGSQRRSVQLLSMCPEVEIVDLRGNIDTRLRKCDSGQVDGVLMAAAALIRSGLSDEITEYLPFETFTPAVGQGALGIEIRRGDGIIEELVVPLNHAPTMAAVIAERAFLRALGGGCQEPIAALGVVEGASLRVRGMVADSASGETMYAGVEGGVADAEALGKRLAREMIEMGAERLIGRCGS